MYVKLNHQCRLIQLTAQEFNNLGIELGYAGGWSIHKSRIQPLSKIEEHIVFIM